MPSILEANSNSYHKELLLDLMCIGTSKDTSELRECIEYILLEKVHLFEGKEFEGSLYPGEDEILSIILPLVRRIWDRIYIHPSTSLNVEKVDILKEYFNIDDFLIYLKDILPKSKGLNVFKYVDKTSEISRIIVDNYIFMITKEIIGLSRNKKNLENHLIEVKREKTFKKILK